MNVEIWRRKSDWVVAVILPITPISHEIACSYELYVDLRWLILAHISTSITILVANAILMIPKMLIIKQNPFKLK